MGRPPGEALCLACVASAALAVAGLSEAAGASCWAEQDEADLSVALIQHGARVRQGPRKYPFTIGLPIDGWVRQRTSGHKAYFQVHIPKTAGFSFAYDVQSVLPEHEGYFTREICFYTELHMQPGDEMVTFLRSPVSHIYSQFMQCKYHKCIMFCGGSPWGASGDPVYENVTTWLRHFDGGHEHEAFHCYDPYNMQTRALSCKNEPDDSRPSHHYHGEPDLAVAIENLDSLFFVGITERYHESVCLFFAKTHAGQSLPSHCDCTDPEAWSAWNSTHDDHGAPPHSDSDLSEEDLSLIRALSRLDARLYEHAVARFRREAAEVERSMGTKILCEE